MFRANTHFERGKHLYRPSDFGDRQLSGRCGKDDLLYGPVSADAPGEITRRAAAGQLIRKRTRIRFVRRRANAGIPQAGTGMRGGKES